jgi:hypothetical protein
MDGVIVNLVNVRWSAAVEYDISSRGRCCKGQIQHTINCDPAIGDYTPQQKTRNQKPPVDQIESQQPKRQPSQG